MVDDDDARVNMSPEELLAPPGPRRSSYTPPANDAASLEAAANVFNDDAIAAAMAAELAKIASGPIPIVPAAYRMPAPTPVTPPSAPSPAEPVQPVVDTPLTEPVAPVTPAAVAESTAFEAPESETPIPSYLGAPAPTVPPADAPPPPGYEDSARYLPPTTVPSVDDGDQRPQRQSLDDEELLSTFHEESPVTGTLSVIEQLQAQLDLREREAREYSAWESSMLALGTPDALAAVERAQSDLASGSFSAPEPPAEPDSPFAPRPEQTESVAWQPAPPADEPSLEGTAFEDFHFADFKFAPPVGPPVDLPSEPVPNTATTPDAAPIPEPPAQEVASKVPFPGYAPPATAPFPGATPPNPPESEPPVREAAERSIFAPPPLVEPPVPDLTYPVFSDQIGVVPAFEGTPEPASLDSVEPEPEPEAEPEARPDLAPDGPATVEPPAAAFDELLTGDSPPDPPQSGSWELPPPNLFTEPTLDAETGAPLPFGSGVGPTEAADPIPGLFSATLASPEVSLAPADSEIVLEDEGAEPAASIAPVLAAESAVRRTQRVFVAELTGEEPTALEHRVGRAARLFWLWFAANSSIVAVVFGGLIFSLGMSLRQAIIATVAGVALSFIPLGFGTLAGKRSGQPTMVVSRATFGVVGNIFPAILGLLSRLFWGAALLWLVGAGAASILGGARLTEGFTSQQVTFVVMVAGFVIVLIGAYFGYALIARIQLVVSIVSAILLIGFVVLTASYIDIPTALNAGDGSWMLAIAGAVLVFSFVGLAWANSGAELARYQRPGSAGPSSILWATFGTALPSFLLIAYGALLCASNPKIEAGILANPLDQLGRLLPVWYPAPLLVATTFSLLSGAILSVYSGGFALQAAGVRVARKYAVLLVGALVLIIALILTLTVTDFSQLFRDFATTVAVPIAAWTGLFASEMMIRRRRFDSGSLLRRGGVYEDARWANLIALVVISAVGFGLTSATVGWLSWEGYLFPVLGVPSGGDVASSDIGVLVALAVGIVFPIVLGIPAIRRQEGATRSPE
jgi:purine-cytosine permease-like protein